MSAQGHKLPEVPARETAASLAPHPSWGDERLIEALPIPVLAVDGECRLIFLNTAGEDFFAQGRKSLIGQELRRFLADDGGLTELLTRVRGQGAALCEVDLELRPAGAAVRRRVTVDAAPLGDDSGGVVLGLHEKPVIDRIGKAVERGDVGASIGAMAAVIAHEVKNPLSGIRGAAQLLEGQAAVEDRALARLIVEEADRIVRLLEGVEAFGVAPPPLREAVNIHEVLDHVVQVARSGFGAETPIRCAFDPSLPPVHGVRDQLVQIFLNLLKNAVEAVSVEEEHANHGKAGAGDAVVPEITLISTFRPGVRRAASGRDKTTGPHLPLEIRVRDNGHGIPPALRRRLFDPFITSKQGGRGLGLALAAKLIADHDGVIDAESRPGCTEFCVLLPVAGEMTMGMEMETETGMQPADRGGT